MPWTTKDVDKHMKGLSADEKGTWVKVANKALASCTKAGHADCDAAAIKQANVVLGKLREAMQEAEGAFLEAVEKIEGGVAFPAGDYAYVPDSKKPSTWKLRLTAKPGGAPDAGIVGAAIAALGKGFRGQPVKIPAADLPAVKARVRAAWKKANPDKKPADMPATIQESQPGGGIFVEAETIQGLLATLGALLEAAGGVNTSGAHEGNVSASHGMEEFKEEGELLEVEDG